MAPTDFFTVELWTPLGLFRSHVLFVIHLATRAVHVTGIVSEPNENWMKPVARNLTVLRHQSGGRISNVPAQTRWRPSPHVSVRREGGLATMWRTGYGTCWTRKNAT